MKEEEIARLRLRRQHLTGSTLPTPEAVVGWFGAVQAQEFGVAKWSIAQRSRGRVTSADLDRALAERRILRTHAVRSTWHFVLPADLRWLLMLVGCFELSLRPLASSLQPRRLNVFRRLARTLSNEPKWKEGGHRALIFSQFVDFLKLVRARLAAEGVSYQYLDGSTPERARGTAVTEFQSGGGDVFLISLKAGGFGLNLTAADYVIHLDPWWNPAVEAQASDRAHRLGQQRPVTIYRLVNAASIEERVLSLHERKQRLAEEILSDAAEPARLDPQALLALLAD